jgi:hypothetical protein
MNTTRLIRNWSMEGALDELNRRFAPPATDIIAAVAEGESEPAGDAAVTDDPARSYVLVKRPGEDDWQPLVSDE